MSARVLVCLAAVAVACVVFSVPIAESEAVSVLDLPISFNPPHSNYVVDADEDSLYEYLVLEVGINVSEPGWYFVVSVLNTDMYSHVWNASYEPYEVGTYVVQIWYSAYDIVSNGLNGTFYADMELYDQHSTKITTSVYTLGEYDIRDFEAVPPTAIEGPHSDEGLDTDGDGAFNYLAVYVRVNVTTAGTYGVKGFVDGLTTNSTGDARNATYLDLGIRSVELRFNGELFVEAELDGPYLIRLELMDGEFNRFYMSEDYTTQDYYWTQFSNQGASFLPPFSDESLDVNDDGAMEYLAVHVYLDVATQGVYNVTGALSVVVTEVDSRWSRSELDVGQQEVTLLFPGDAVKATMYNGSFTVRLDLYDGSGTWLWNYVHRTQFYSWIDFALPPVASLVTEVVADGTNLNMTLDASVSVVDAIEYEVRWDFNGDGVWDTDWSTDKTIVYQFPGPGDYTVILEVRDLRGLTSLSTLQVTVEHPVVIDYPEGDDGFMTLSFLLASGLLVGVAVLVLAWPVEVLVTAAAALLMPLYARLRDEDVLDNYRRGMIHGLVLAHPGICFSDIKEALSMATGPLVYHLGVLQRSGDVISRRSGTLTRYYINGTSVSQIARLGLTDLQVEIVRLVISKGQVTKGDIQKAVGVSRQVVHYNLKKLVTDRIIASSFVGGHRFFKMAIGGDPSVVEAFKKELSSESGLRQTAESVLDELPD